MNNNNKIDKRNVLIVLLIFVVVILCVILFVVINDKYLKTNNHTVSDVIENENDLITEISKLDEEEALKLGNELYEYAYSAYWGGEPAWKSHVGEVNSNGGRELVCDTKASDVKKKFATDFKYKDYNGDKEYKVDDFVNPVPEESCGGHARGGIQSYDTTNLKVKEITENKIVFDAESVYCSTSFCNAGHDRGSVKNNQFIIVKEKDAWLISYFVLPN